MSSRSIHLFIVESDPVIAQAIAGVALEALPAEPETVLAKSSGVAGAKRLLDRLAPGEAGTIIVVCAVDLADGKGLDVLGYARERHPETRVVLMTNGEREELGSAVLRRVDGVVSKPNALQPLRAILAYLAREKEPRLALQDERVVALETTEFQQAVAAVEAALESVERAHDRLRHAAGEEAGAARRALTEAEILATELHRRMLEAERRLLGTAAPGVRE